MPKTDTLERHDLDLADFDREVTCPAGCKHELLGGPGVECRIEEGVIHAATNPRSLIFYCMGNYRLCPTWRAEKARIDEGRVKPLIHEVEPERLEHERAGVAVGEVPEHLR